jgi:very-short-patch-repair endonuclease
MRQTTKATVAKARALRRTMTQPEARMWQILRDRPGGFKFRRQHPAGPYVLDFYCPATKLVVEIDGEAHDMGSNPARDASRDEWLRARGYRVVRIPAREIGSNAEVVLQHLLSACSE